jgi:hypothetical protein
MTLAAVTGLGRVTGALMMAFSDDDSFDMLSASHLLFRLVTVH